MKGLELFPVTLSTMTDQDLWRFFVQHRDLCSCEFWEEVANRKAAGILCQDSPFWTMRNVGRFLTRGSDKSNLIELTREEWEARRRRKKFRVISA
jgi:hypothetical protein